MTALPLDKARYEVGVLKAFGQKAKAAGLIYSYAVKNIIMEAGKQYGRIYVDPADETTTADLFKFAKDNPV